MPERSVDYDEIATQYDSRYQADHYPQLEEEVAAFVRDRRVLEVGCGTGYWLAVAQAAGADVAGVDASEHMLSLARRRLPNAELMTGRAESLSWDDSTFDRVICINALHHFDDPSRFIGEAARVLRPSGQMTVGLDPYCGLDAWWIYDCFEGTVARDRARYPSAERIMGWFTDAGLNDARTYQAEHLHWDLTVEEARSAGYLEKATTSQLVLLREQEYYARIQSILESERAADGNGEVLSLRTDLRLWATTGRRGDTLGVGVAGSPLPEVGALERS